MIPVLIYYLYRRYKRSHPTGSRPNPFTKRSVRIALLCVVFIMIAVFAFSQDRKLEYQIKRKGDVVGTVMFTEASAGNKIMRRMQSEVKTRFVFLFTARAQEESIYENGIMVWSSIYRKLNGSEKVNKKTQASGESYVVYRGDKTELLKNYPIRNNMLCLYTNEPVSYSKVYSDNFQQFLDIQKIGTDHYKIELPDGNYNEYFYSNGLCSRVEIHHTMYSATIELKK